MCGRYVRRSDKQRIAEHFHVHGPSLPNFGPSWNVAPQTFQPIVRLNGDTGERELVLMRWGLIPFWILLANSGRAAEVSENRGGLNWSVQHYLEVYLPEFESPKFVAGVD
jgi:putative SOS response-associated peptidase YedK